MTVSNLKQPKQTDDATLRMDCVREILVSIAAGLSNVRVVLEQNRSDDPLVYLASDALERLSFLAGRALVVSGDGAVCRPENWILGDKIVDMIDRLGEAPSTSASKAA